MTQSAAADLSALWSVRKLKLHH